ncbi:MAG TPA: cell division protein FtsL [Syntrophothermus lipocalidus]|nr:cell division protein FtsL [Syntrophothermus lipocalidus]
MPQANHIMVQGYPVRAGVPVVTKVRRITKRRNLQSVRLIAIIAALFGLGLLAVFIRCQLAVLGYQIVELKQEIADLDQQNRHLELRIAELSSPSRIETLAVTKLGMCKPDEVQVVALKEEVPVVPVESLSRPKTVGQAEEKPLEKLYRVVVKLGSSASKKTLGMID